MFEEIIEKMKNNGVDFAEGLTDEEIEKIEDCYRIEFPKELKAFYKEALPISNGFYNWRDLSKSNDEKIADRIRRPKQDLLEAFEEIDWPEAWGSEPYDDDEKATLTKAKILTSADLIPIYSHRYITNQYDEGNPVFSIVGWDIICYGENLEKYLEREFIGKSKDSIKLDDIKKVDFWSDFL